MTIKILVIWFILLIAAFMASCSTRPQVSNHPRQITLAKYRVGNTINMDDQYQGCTAKVINIIDDSSDSYYYQLVISCMNEKITKIIPQQYIDNK